MELSRHCVMVRGIHALREEVVERVLMRVKLGLSIGCVGTFQSVDETCKVF